jgi:mono/diheme cytochrome c family protein
LNKQMKLVLLFCLTAASVACQNIRAGEPARSAVAPRGQAYAQSSCGGCHAIAGDRASPNSNAPPFPAIVNQEGLTAETLSHWLRGAHNYPGDMDFSLGERQVDELVAYMLTLRDPNYRRPPD